MLSHSAACSVMRSHAGPRVAPRALDDFTTVTDSEVPLSAPDAPSWALADGDLRVSLGCVSSLSRGYSLSPPPPHPRTHTHTHHTALRHTLAINWPICDTRGRACTPVPRVPRAQAAVRRVV